MSYTSQLGTSTSQLGSYQLAGTNTATIYTRDLTADSLVLLDTFTGYITTASFSDSIVFVDSMVGFKGVLIDTMTLTDSMVATHVALGALSDTLTFTEYFIQTHIEEFDDTLVLDDEFVGEAHKIGNFSDVLTITESLLQTSARGRLFGDLLEFAEVWHRNFSKLVSFSDTVTFSDSLTGVAVRVLGDSFTFLDVISGVLAKLFSDTVEFGDALTANHVTRKSMTDQVVLFDSLTLSLYTRQTYGDTLILSDAITGYATRPIHDTLTITDTVSGVATTPLFDTVAFTEGLTFLRVINKTLSDNLIFSDSTSMAKIITLALNDALTLIELWQATRVRFGSISDTISFADEQLRAVIPRTISDTLVLTDELLYEKIGNRDMNDSLPLSDQLTVKTVLTRHLNDSVLFLDAFAVKLIRNSITAPPSFPPVHQVLPPDGLVNPPYPVWEAVIDVQPQLILTGKTRSIVLPPPEFNDFEAGQGKIVVQRSMTGRFRVYAKRTQREKLNWRFVLPKNKADELRDFMLAEIDTVLNVITWEGDYWQVQILTDSADFTETGRWAPCGNKVEVTIELVGNRYV